MPIHFHTEDVSYSLKNPLRIRLWVASVIASEEKKTGTINFIFCSDEYLLALNNQYLKHDYYTDIITFDQSDDKKIISGDIYISIDRVKENALAKRHKRTLAPDSRTTDNKQLTTNHELHRVMIHGVLHLLGYDDKRTGARKIMRKKEDMCLALLQQTKQPGN